MPWMKSCLCHQEKKKPVPVISPPLHLLLKSEHSISQGPSHAFRCKIFKKPRPCHLCHQPILNQGSCCRVCKYVCHKVCESKEAVARYTDTSWHIHRQNVKKSNLKKIKSNTKRKNASLTFRDSTDTENDENIDYCRIAQHKNSAYVTSIKSHDVNRNDGQNPDAECENFNNYAQIKSHSHEDTNEDGSGMHKIISSSAYNGFSETFTTQPKPTNAKRICSDATAGNMDLSYVTERIIALQFPGSSTSQFYKRSQRQASHMLRHKHGSNYKVFNLTEPRRILIKEHRHVREVGWAKHLAPPLETLCSICKEMDTWLSTDEHRIAVLHAKGDKDKLGVIVAAYMQYSSICGNPEQALDRFSMRKFLDDNVGPIQLPSNRRYVHYFGGLLSHDIKINTAPLYLTHVTVLGTPSFEEGGCRAFLKIYQGHFPVYTSGVYYVGKGIKQFTISVTNEQRQGLQLRGDILVKCYHHNRITRETIFACQFHTCAVTDYTLSFTRQELDVAFRDPRFPNDGVLELNFSSGPEIRQPAPAPTPAVPYVSLTEAYDDVVRAESPLDFEHDRRSDNEDDADFDAVQTNEDVNHTFGPLDGSIYATIAKKSDLSPGTVSSPLTVSMDSGISSAGHQQNSNCLAASASPPLTVPPLSPEDRHRELDELLTDMMLTVESIPDFKPASSSSSSRNNESSTTTVAFHDLENVRFIDDADVEEDNSNTTGVTVTSPSSFATSSVTIPYHARQDSRPFSYGLNTTAMVQDTQQKLSSPSLVRKASFEKNGGSGETKNSAYDFPAKSASATATAATGYATSPSYGYAVSNLKRSNNVDDDVVLSGKDPIDDLFTVSALSADKKGNVGNATKREFREEYFKEERRRYDPLKRSLTEGTIRKSPGKIVYVRSATTDAPPACYSAEYTESLSPPNAFRSVSPDLQETYGTSPNGYAGGNHLTWLQKQQQKLKERKERQLREERFPHESRLLSELRSMQQKQHHRYRTTTASVRNDGYTSDTTAFADDDDDYYTVPLHVNIMQQRQIAKSAASPQQKPVYERFQSFDLSPTSSMAQEEYSNTSRKSLASEKSNGLLSLVQRNNKQQHSTNNSQHRNNNSDIMYREKEETINTWKMEPLYDSSQSQTISGSPGTRPPTPAFPVHARTPYSNSSSCVQFDLRSTEKLPPKSPTTQRKDLRPSSPIDSTDNPMSEYVPHNHNFNINNSHLQVQKSSSAIPHRSPGDVQTSGRSISPNTLYYYGNSRRSSVNSNGEPPLEVAPANVKFVRDTSKYWYKPNISREDAIRILKSQQPGAFIVRDSNSFPGAFGMALRVATVPETFVSRMEKPYSPLTSVSSSSSGDELIRHYLIEPTSRGVRLKGCQNEPVFTSLSALVYQHSVTQMALPCKLVLPDGEQLLSKNVSAGLQDHQQQLLSQGAACNVLYIYSMDVESLTGPQAIRKTVISLMQMAPLPEAVVVHFKVNGQGITLTDNKRQMFFRKHYPIGAISHCSIDPDGKQWTSPQNATEIRSANRLFGFVSRKANIKNPDNQCHLFAEYEPEQPASAIVNFVNKIMSTTGIKANMV